MTRWLSRWKQWIVDIAKTFNIISGIIFCKQISEYGLDKQSEKLDGQLGLKGGDQKYEIQLAADYYWCPSGTI